MQGERSLTCMRTQPPASLFHAVQCCRLASCLFVPAGSRRLLIHPCAPRLLCALAAPQPCPAHTVTADQVVPEDAQPDSELYASVTSNAVTSMDQCSTLPGYGWGDGQAVPCSVGFYAPGFDNQVCVCVRLSQAPACKPDQHSLSWRCLALHVLNFLHSSPTLLALTCCCTQACVACGQGLTTVTTMSRRTTDCIALPGWEIGQPF